MASIFTQWNTVEEATLMKLSKKQTCKWGGCVCVCCKWVSEGIKLLFKTPDCWTRFVRVAVGLRKRARTCGFVYACARNRTFV